MVSVIPWAEEIIKERCQNANTPVITSVHDIRGIYCKFRRRQRRRRQAGSSSVYYQQELNPKSAFMFCIIREEIDLMRLDRARLTLTLTTGLALVSDSRERKACSVQNTKVDLELVPKFGFDLTRLNIYLYPSRALNLNLSFFFPLTKTFFLAWKCSACSRAFSLTTTRPVIIPLIPTTGNVNVPCLQAFYQIKWISCLHFKLTWVLSLDLLMPKTGESSYTGNSRFVVNI